MNTVTINESTRFYFTADTGITDFSQVNVIKDGLVITGNALVVTEVSGIPGLYVITLTPSATGRYAIHFQSKIQASFEVVSKSIYTYLKNVEDEALGSWSWNKQTGKLTMVRQDGTNMAEFDVVESLQLASRERVS